MSHLVGNPEDRFSRFKAHMFLQEEFQACALFFQTLQSKKVFLVFMLLFVLFKNV